MRLLGYLIAILATLSMTAHVGSTHVASAQAGSAHVAHRAVAVLTHADHDHAAVARHGHAGKATVADRDCPPGHHKDHRCCDMACCSAPCVRPVIAEGAFEPVFRLAARPMPDPDRLPAGTLGGRLIRPPIFG